MAGSYCKFCGHRCFVDRVLPDGRHVHMATCEKGMAFDREHTGYDQLTARNPREPELSTNARAEQLMGRRDEGRPIGIVLFSPAEQGYRCPVHPEGDGHGIEDESLHWSEYRGFLWCELCNRDYPSVLCCAGPDALDRATIVFLDTVRDAIERAAQQMEASRRRVDASSVTTGDGDP